MGFQPARGAVATAPELDRDERGIRVDLQPCTAAEEAARPARRALAPFVEAEAWGDPIDIVLPVQENFAQLILQRDGVDLYSNGIEVDLDRFRRAAADLSLELHSLTGGIQVEPAVPSEPQLFVEIRDDWPAVAEAVIHMIRVIYGTDGRDEVEVRFT